MGNSGWLKSVFNSIGGDTVPQGGNRGKGRGLRRKPMNSVCDILSLRYLQSIAWKIQWAAGMWLLRRERGLSYRRARKQCQKSRRSQARTHLHSTGEQWRRTLKRQWKGTPRGGRISGGPKKVVLQGGGHGQCQIPKEGQIRRELRNMH